MPEIKGKFTPDVSKLQEGMLIKNYAVFCELVGQSKTTGCSKKAQLAEWQRYIEYERDGQKFFIIKIKDIPDAPNEHRVRQGLYVAYIEYLLMKYLANQNGYEITITKRELYLLLGMTSKRLFDNTLKAQYMDNRDDAEKAEVLSFYHRAEEKLNSIIISALNSMQGRYLIKYNKEYVISTIEECDNGYKIFNNRVVTDSATILEILKIENQALSALELKSQHDAIVKNKIKAFYDKVNEIAKQTYGWDCISSHLRIIYIADQIKNSLPIHNEKLRKLSTEYQMMGLNKSIVNAVNKQAVRRYESQNGNEWGEDNPMRSKSVYLLSDNYVKVQKQLATELIQINRAEARERAIQINKNKYIESADCQDETDHKEEN